MGRTHARERDAAIGRAPVPPDATAAYGDHPEQIIDFYAPRGAVGDTREQARWAADGARGGAADATGSRRRGGADGRSAESGRAAPLAVLIHGGFWRQEFDRVHVSPFASFLAAHGFAVGSVEYRRVGGAGGAPATFDDIADAVDTVAERAVKALGPGTVDPGTVVLAGHSAGGHLALWSAARHRLPPDSSWHRPVPLPVCGVVALAPVADLSAAIGLALGEGAALQLLGGAGRSAERLPLADPVRLLPTGIATTIVQGTTDITVPPQVAEGFAAAAAAAGEPVRMVRLDGTGHFPLIDPHTDAGAKTAEELRRLVAGLRT